MLSAQQVAKLTIELRNYILALGFERLTLGAMLAFIHSHR